MTDPDEIPAAALREREAHDDLLRARRDDDARRLRVRDPRRDDTPPAR